MSPFELAKQFLVFNLQTPKQNLGYYVIVVVLLALAFLKKPKNTKTSRQNAKITRLPSLPLIGSLHLLPKLFNDSAGTFQEYAERYGSTVLETTVFGKRCVLITNPIYLKKLLMSDNPGHLTKPKHFYQAIFPDISKEGLIATTNIPEWKVHRNILNKAFTYTALGSYLDIFNKQAKALAEELDGNPNESLCKKLNVTTSKVITEVLIGEDSLSEREYIEVSDDIERVQDIIAYRFSRPWFLLSKFLWKLSSRSAELTTTLKNLEYIFMKAINRCLKKKNQEKGNSTIDNKSVMEMLIEAGLSNREIISEIANGYVAGQDTTSKSIQMLLYQLARYPVHQRLCRDEVNRVLAGSEKVTMEHLSEMKHLDRCVRESLRLFPPAIGYGRDLTTDLKLDEDLTIEAGALVTVSMWMVHRNPEFYPNPSLFDPDRFLSDNSSNRSQFEYLVFSHGPRHCIGWKMAMFQIKIVTAYLLRQLYFYMDTDGVLKAEQKLKEAWPIPDVGVKLRPLRSDI